VLLGVTLFIRRRNADPLLLRANKAGSELEAALKHARGAPSDQQKIDIILRAFNQYLGDKLRLPAAALTFNDVRDLLKERGVEQETLERLKAFFETCDVGRYAGDSGPLDAEPLIQTSLTLMRQLNRCL